MRKAAVYPERPVAASAGASLALADMPDQLAAHLKETGFTDRFTSVGDPGPVGGLQARMEDPGSS